VLSRLYGLTGDKLYHERAQQTLEAFAGIAPQMGLFAASWALAAQLLAAHPVQVVVTGAAGDSAAKKLEDAALAVFRLGKSVLRVTPERIAGNALPPALAETIPRLDAAKAQALVCANSACRPPMTRADELCAALGEPAAVPSR
jgi:hypothetical protein